MSIKRKKLLLSFLVLNALTIILGVLGWDVFCDFVIRLNDKELQKFMLAIWLLLMGLVMFVYKVDSDKEVIKFIDVELNFIGVHLLLLFIPILVAIITITKTGELPNIKLVGIEVVLLFDSLVYMFNFFISGLAVEFKNKLKKRLTVTIK